MTPEERKAAIARIREDTHVCAIVNGLTSRIVILTDHLSEAHEPDRQTVVNGRSHAGDGRAGCSYCDSIQEAREYLKRVNP